jgi:hypothetical protein
MTLFFFFFFFFLRWVNEHTQSVITHSLLWDIRCHPDILENSVSDSYSLNSPCQISMEQVRYQQTSPAVAVDGAIDKKPSKSPCKRNPRVILLQLNSAQKKRTPTNLSPSIGSS